ncbi:Flp family type IVb pilin [Agromyces sp. NPDC057679]|uniref:Flp family type IVb pilin n=1 Tax=Agromyces sp. NPDC057679 TaxID=3346207 RepID=UPI00366E955C
MLKAYAALQARINSLRSDDEGATAVEYGLIVAAIAAVIVVIVFTLGGQIQAAFQTVSTAITNGNTPPAT